MVFMIIKNIENLTKIEILELFRDIDSKFNNIIELDCSPAYFNRFTIRGFVELAEIFLCKVETITQDNKTYKVVLKRLDQQKSFHNQDQGCEKYGIDSEFFKINKIDELSFLYYYQEALKFVDIANKTDILNVGVNKGDEFLVLKKLLKEDEFSKKNLLGIDYSKTAINYAKKEFSEYKNVDFLCADINKLDQLNLNRFDLLISIGTLQSSNINFNAKFMQLYQDHLKKDGAVVLGFPNCRWIDGEIVYGAKAPNYSFNEMSLVLKDIHFCKKYLQQKGYRVVVTGKEYLFLSARKIKN